MFAERILAAADLSRFEILIQEVKPYPAVSPHCVALQFLKKKNSPGMKPSQPT